MTDDIVTRLRDEVARCWCAEKSQNEPVGKPFFRCESCDNQLRAADEIERLRAEVTTSERFRLEDGMDAAVRIGALEAEIKRLRAVLDGVDDLHSPRIAHDTCVACNHDWPCPTHQLLRPEAKSHERRHCDPTTE